MYNIFIVSIIVLDLAASFLWLCYVHTYVVIELYEFTFFSDTPLELLVELWSQPILFDTNGCRQGSCSYSFIVTI